MKSQQLFLTLKIFIIILLFGSSCIHSQTVDYENYHSVVTAPPNFNPTINHPISKTDITNGYENFYLGVDLGEPYIATNPRDLLNSICAFNFNDVYLTTNGYTWNRITVLFPGFGSVLGDPVMCYDSLGNIYYIQIVQPNATTYGLAVQKSTNKGQTWIGPYQANSTTAGLNDKEWITADQSAGPFSNYVYVGWRQFGSQSNMRCVRSTNGGVNWSSPITISGSQGAYITVGPNGNIPGGNVYFGCLNGGQILVCRSTDGGATFGTQVGAAIPLGPGVTCAGRNTVKSCIRTDPFPRMASDNSYTSTRGNVYVAYASNVPANNKPNIYVVRSTDFGQTWSTPVIVNDDVQGVVDHWMPSISVDKGGRVFLTWYDSRIDQANNIMTQLYGAVSTNGGVSFGANFPISDVPFNPNTMAVPQPGGEKYIGDYIGCSAVNGGGYAVWMDGRNNTLGSFTSFFPDFAMFINPTSANLGNNDSTTVTIRIPSTKGILYSAVKFTGTIDTLPQSGSINISFQNGKDSITNYPDSVVMKIRTIGSVTPRLYNIRVKGNCLNGTPIHVRNFSLLVNSSYVNVNTNRPGNCNFLVNGISYNSLQNLVFSNGANVTVSAPSPQTVGPNRYVFLNWSDNGDTTHSFTVTGNINLTAFYKIQYHLILISSIGNAFGDGFYDSSTSATIYVPSRNVIYQGNPYTFAGWNGLGPNSYTSPDSSGTDTAHTFQHVLNPFDEIARWVEQVGIKKIGTDVPTSYSLYQNYPNPFNPSTTINFDIIQTGIVKLTLYDVTGKKIKDLINENLETGRYSFNFNLDNYASGIYFYRITSNKFTAVKKMLLVK